MRRSVRLSAPVMVAALAFGGLAVAVAPSAAACGGYGEPACQTFTLSFNANGGSCNPSTVSATENTWATLLSASQCRRSGFTLTSWLSGVSPFAPGAQVFVTGNAGFTAVWTQESTSSPTASPTSSPTEGTSTPTASPTGSPTVTASIPPGQTNPDRRVVVAPGVVLVNNNVAERTEPTEVRARNSRSQAISNADEVRVGRVFQAQVTFRPTFGLRNLFMRLTTPSGEVVDFGRIRVDRNAQVLTPAIRYTEPGTYLWRFATGNADDPVFFAVRVI